MLKRGVMFFLLMLLCMMSCKQQKESVVAPWGEIADSISLDNDFDLDAIEQSGEMIALTISGPNTYYEFHGRGLGIHYLLCQRLADSLGVKLRMEVCRDTTEMLQRLAQGDADLIAFPLTTPDSVSPGWKIGPDKPLLTEAFQQWYRLPLLAEAERQQKQLLSQPRVRRRIFAPMLNRSGGIISRYDGLFQHHSALIHWDWKLMAAQCYQESTFDPEARSWAGAVGLMQIMPTTADHLGLPRADLTSPEKNIAAAARYLAELNREFSDIRNRRERQEFVLAAYNGGSRHIRDAMALAARDGRDSHCWNNVKEYVLRLSEAQYYQDPIVKHGYMRGSETVDYVASIRRRWLMYRGGRVSGSDRSRR